MMSAVMHTTADAARANDTSGLLDQCVRIEAEMRGMLHIHGYRKPRCHISERH